MARRKKAMRFTPASVGRAVEKMLGDFDARHQRTQARRNGGETRPVTLAGVSAFSGRWIKCSDCAGKGAIGWTEANRRGLSATGARASGVPCPRCGGDGEIPEPAAT